MSAQAYKPIALQYAPGKGPHLQPTTLTRRTIKHNMLCGHTYMKLDKSAKPSRVLPSTVVIGLLSMYLQFIRNDDLTHAIRLLMDPPTIRAHNATQGRCPQIRISLACHHQTRAHTIHVTNKYRSDDSPANAPAATDVRLLLCSDLQRFVIDMIWCLGDAMYSVQVAC